MLQAVRRCRRWASAPGAARLVFWSGFSLDFTLFGLEMVMPYSLNLCSTARSLLSCSLPTPCAQTSSFIWVGMGCIFKFAKTFNYGATDEQIFLAATSSWRSDDVTLSVCLSACLLVCHLIFLAVNFAPLHFSPLNLCNTCTFQRLHFSTLALFNTCTLQHLQQLGLNIDKIVTKNKPKMVQKWNQTMSQKI